MHKSRQDILYRYSQFSVDRNIDKSKVINLFFNELLKNDSYLFQSNDFEVLFYYRLNQWETDYFGINSLFLYYVDYECGQIVLLKKALKSFLDFLRLKYYKGFILTIEIPPEDNELVQFLNNERFRTIETRLQFLNNNLDDFKQPRYEVREATFNDIPNLKYIASFMRNKYDRFHSDWSFSIDKADKYLSTYIENSINGFADIVITPNQKHLPADSFLTANIYSDLWSDLEYPISKMVLSAVSSETNKGWYIKLISEMTYKLYDLGARAIFMNTQATNIAVIATWEKLGYKYVRATHVLTINSND